MTDIKKSPNKWFSLLNQFYNDKPLVLAWIILITVTTGNVLNKILLGFEPLQYSLFSYDKILHLLFSIILVRSFYWVLKQNNHEKSQRKLIIKASLLALFLYGLVWEPFEIFTFLIQESRQEQFSKEVFDVPLDWLYDIAGVLISNFLEYK